jgi:hypothetical protein
MPRQKVRDFGKALAFDGSATYLTSPVTPSNSGFNVAFWFRLHKATSQQRMVAYTASGPNGGFFIEKSSSGKILKFDIYNGGSQAVDISTTDLLLNTWYHCVCTFKTNEAKLYINAVQQGSTDTSCSMSTPASQTVTIGRSSSAASAFFQGLMDEFVFENTDTPWTQTQIKEETKNALVKTAESVPRELFQTITFDNGTENVQHAEIKQEYGIETYFCDPFASWQKGSVENMNKLIRRYLPRHTDLSKLTNQDIFLIQEKLNNRPRKVLKYQTPNEVIKSGAVKT